MAARTCPACGEGGLAPFLEIPRLPVYCNVLWRTRAEALDAPSGAMTLAACSACGHLYNTAFDPDLVDYTPDYENSLHVSPRFQSYAEELAEKLIADHDLHGADVVEIGCGKGEFLELLCRRGDNRGRGFDASYDGRVDKLDGVELEIVRDYYSERHADHPADLICSRHVLEHIPEPLGFMRGVAAAARRAGTRCVFFEVPDGMWTLRDLGIWDLIYEHCSYFTAPSLARVFERAGLSAKRVYTSFGGQFLCIEAGTGAGLSSVAGRDSGAVAGLDSDAGADAGRDSGAVAVAGPDREAARAEVASLVAGFREHYDAKVRDWNERLAEAAAAGRKLAVWGAGSKGVTFLNVMSDTRAVHAVIDINARKQGRFTPGTGHEVCAPEALAAMGIDTVLVMNPLYADEIAQQAAAAGCEADVQSV